jgi:Domain of unknown function (DUF6766)
MPLDHLRQLWRDYALGIVASLLFLATLLGGAIAGWFEYADWAHSHGIAETMLGDNGYAWVLGEQAFQNWQSEWLAVAILIVVAVRLIHRGSPQSRDGRDQMARAIDDVERRLDALLEQRAGS